MKGIFNAITLRYIHRPYYKATDTARSHKLVFLVLRWIFTISKNIPNNYCRP